MRKRIRIHFEARKADELRRLLDLAVFKIYCVARNASIRGEYLTDLERAMVAVGTVANHFCHSKGKR
jgi:hypothetical protein